MGISDTHVEVKGATDKNAGWIREAANELQVPLHGKLVFTKSI